jgi:hypothetical protein
VNEEVLADEGLLRQKSYTTVTEVFKLSEFLNNQVYKETFLGRRFYSLSSNYRLSKEQPQSTVRWNAVLSSLQGRKTQQASQVCNFIVMLNARKPEYKQILDNLQCTKFCFYVLIA